MLEVRLLRMEYGRIEHLQVVPAKILSWDHVVIAPYGSRDISSLSATLSLRHT